MEMRLVALLLTDMDELAASADATCALEAQRGRLADMDYIARVITGQIA